MGCAPVPVQGVYAYAALQKPPFPDEVDVARREQYLDDSEFERLFQATKDEFSRQPKWKQVAKKKALCLF